jgi:hypothetical protein
VGLVDHGHAQQRSPQRRPPAGAHHLAHVHDVDRAASQALPEHDRGRHGREDGALGVIPEGRAVEARELADRGSRQVPSAHLSEARGLSQPAWHEGERLRRKPSQLAQRRVGLDGVGRPQGEARGAGDVAEARPGCSGSGQRRGPGAIRDRLARGLCRGLGAQHRHSVAQSETNAVTITPLGRCHPRREGRPARGGAGPRRCRGRGAIRPWRLRSRRRRPGRRRCRSAAS